MYVFRYVRMYMLWEGGAMRVYLFIYLFIHSFIYVSMYSHMRVCICTCAKSQVFVYWSTDLFVYFILFRNVLIYMYMFLRNVLMYIYMYIYVYLQKYADVHLLLMYMYVLRNVLTHMYVYCTRACTDLETHRGKIENTHVYVHAYLLRMHMHTYCTCIFTAHAYLLHTRAYKYGNGPREDWEHTGVSMYAYDIFTAHARVQIWRRTAGRLRTHTCIYMHIYCVCTCIFTAHACVQIWRRTAGRLRTYPCFQCAATTATRHACLCHIILYHVTSSCTVSHHTSVSNVLQLLPQGMHVYVTSSCTMSHHLLLCHIIPVFPMCCDYCYKAWKSKRKNKILKKPLFSALVGAIDWDTSLLYHIIFYYVTSSFTMSHHILLCHIIVLL